MRIFVGFLVFGVLAVTSAARADSTVSGNCRAVGTDPGSGCSCGKDETIYDCASGNDLSVPRPPDMSAPRDLSSAPDSGLDARREKRRRRQASNGRGLVLLSGASALVLAALRRRYKTKRPTPAENALAASATRSDS